MINELSEWLNDNTLYLLLVVGILFTFLWLMPFKKRLRIGIPAALAIAILAEIIGLAIVKCFAAMENPGSDQPFAGISLFGGVFFMPLVFWIGARLTKRKTSEVFDVLAIALIFTMLCARVNCLITGCCEGHVIPGTNLLRWPTREAEIIYYLVFILLMAPKVLKGMTKGEVYPLYMISYGAFRFIIEFFRVSHNSDKIIHISHFWAIISLCLGLTFYLEQRKRRK